MPRLVLTQEGEEVVVGGEVQLIGLSSAGDMITLVSGTILLDGSFAKGGDTIFLPGGIAEYVVRLEGSRAILTSGSLTLSMPIGLRGNFLHFDDDQALISIDEATGQAVMGGVPLTAEPQPVQPIPPPPPPPLPPPVILSLALDGDVVQEIYLGWVGITLGSGRDDGGDGAHQYVLTVRQDEWETPPIFPYIPSFGVDARALQGDNDGLGIEEGETVEVSALGAYVDFFFLGGGGNDSVIGSLLGDEISGGGGNDLLVGSLGDDLIEGGDGDDLISGDGGADRLSGGAGSDRFIYARAGASSEENPDIILDFTSGEDRIDVSGLRLEGERIGVDFRGNTDGRDAAEQWLRGGAGDRLGAVFDTEARILWIDVNGNRRLDGEDLAIHLPATAAIQAADILSFAASDGA